MTKEKANRVQNKQEKHNRTEVRNLSHRRNLDTMKLLVSDTEFQKCVREIRSRLKIPEEGFIGHDAARRTRQWQEWMTQESDRVMDSKEFREKEGRLWKRQTTMTDIGYRMHQKQKELLYHEVPIRYFAQELDFLIDKFRLPLHFHDCIREFVINCVVDAPHCNFTIGGYPPFTSLEHVRYVPLKIFTRLTDDELEMLKRECKLFTDRLPRYEPLKDIDHRLKIEEWFYNRERMDKETLTPYRTTLKEIAENEFGNAHKTKQVYDVVRELKDLRRQRFNRSGKRDP